MTKTIKIKAILGSIITIAILAGVIAGANLTSTGRAIVFAVTDPATLNHAAQLKADYVNQFPSRAQKGSKGGTAEGGEPFGAGRGSGRATSED